MGERVPLGTVGSCWIIPNEYSTVLKASQKTASHCDDQRMGQSWVSPARQRQGVPSPPEGQTYKVTDLGGFSPKEAVSGSARHVDMPRFALAPSAVRPPRR